MKFYAIHNKNGLQLTYNSIGWQIFAFSKKLARDEFLKEMYYQDSRPNTVKAITRNEALFYLRKGIYADSDFSADSYYGEYTPSEKNELTLKMIKLHDFPDE